MNHFSVSYLTLQRTVTRFRVENMPSTDATQITDEEFKLTTFVANNAKGTLCQFDLNLTQTNLKLVSQRKTV